MQLVPDILDLMFDGLPSLCTPPGYFNHRFHLTRSIHKAAAIDIIRRADECDRVKSLFIVPMQQFLSTVMLLLGPSYAALYTPVSELPKNIFDFIVIAGISSHLLIRLLIPITGVTRAMRSQIVWRKLWEWLSWYLTWWHLRITKETSMKTVFIVH